jgi:hypothetical protein
MAFFRALSFICPIAPDARRSGQRKQQIAIASSPLLFLFYLVRYFALRYSPFANHRINPL